MSDAALAPADERTIGTGVLAALFARTLGLARVGDDEDFFDLGGDSILATTLMLDIEKATGRSLSMTTLYDAPTPAAMARVLDEIGGEAASPPAESRLVLLRPGAAPALFIPHGLLGIVTDLYDFAQRLETKQAVYGIQAVGGSGAGMPADRVEDMARAYVDEIRRAQPEGPYLLAGYCFGGLIALEMAQTLRSEGDDVALLTLLDTHPHSRHWPLRYRVAKWFRLIGSQLSGHTVRNMARYVGERLRGLPPGERLRFLVTRLGRGLLVPFSLFRLSVMLHRFEVADAPAARARVAHPEAVRRMNEICLRAFQDYRPRHYDGEVVLMQTLARKRVQFDGRAVWSGLTRRLTVSKIDAHDWESVGPLVGYFAAPLSRMLRARAT